MVSNVEFYFEHNFEFPDTAHQAILDRKIIKTSCKSTNSCLSINTKGSIKIFILAEFVVGILTGTFYPIGGPEFVVDCVATNRVPTKAHNSGSQV